MIGLMTMAFAAAATTPTPLAPSGKWVVDYQKDACVVARQFGPADAPTTFAVKPTISMEEKGETLFVLAPNTGGTGVRRGQASITLGPSGEQRKVSFVSWVPKGMKARAYEVYADADLVAAMANTASVTIAAGDNRFSFATGKMQAVQNAMRACNENLLRTWGVDPAAMAPALSDASVASWFPLDSYPSDAKRRGAQGRIVIVLTVSSNGKPTACRTVINADPDLDRTTCALALRNGRFEKSASVADRFAVLAVRWELWDI